MYLLPLKQFASSSATPGSLSYPFRPYTLYYTNMQNMQSYFMSCHLMMTATIEKGVADQLRNRHSNYPSRSTLLFVFVMFFKTNIYILHIMLSLYMHNDI